MADPLSFTIKRSTDVDGFRCQNEVNPENDVDRNNQKNEFYWIGKLSIIVELHTNLECHLRKIWSQKTDTYITTDAQNRS